jgi:hypothetical protein
MTASLTLDTPQELAHRANDGVAVTLLWSAPDNRLIVQVSDAKSGDFLELEANSDKALDVFYHPYAYAAFRGIDYQASRRVAGETVYA